jgi:hypothetical protein
MPEPDDTPTQHPAEQASAALTPMAAMSYQAHEWFGCFLAAGFNEGQAMYLVAVQLCGGPRPPA